MPRDGSQQYHVPPGTLATTNFTIESTKYNAFTADLEQDLNLPRPIVAGGTGASDPVTAMNNLGGEIARQVITNYNSDPLQAGSFYSAAGATGAPTANAFTGICYSSSATNTDLFIEARDQVTTSIWMRQKKAGVWQAWQLTDGVVVSDTPPASAADDTLWWESDSGLLYVKYNDGNSSQWVIACPQPDIGTFGKTPASWSRTVLTSGSGTYNRKVGCTAILVKCLGAGGGAGGGGTGGTGGGNGAATSFGTSLLLANGGSAGGSSGNGYVAGGAASGGDINIGGQAGQASFGAGGASSVIQGPTGANSPLFSGAGQGGWPGAPGIAGTANSGSGGGAGGTGGTGSSGGSGAAGGYCEKLITSPAASYPYAVGAGGNGGTGGSGGSAGGAGGSGIIIIEEYF